MEDAIMDSFNRKWLTLWYWGVGVFGLVLAGFGLAATDGPARAMFVLLGNPVADQPDSHLRFAVGLMGCVTMGWAVTLAAAFRAAWALPAAQAAPIWKLVLMSALVWVVPDSIISVTTGFPMNVASNALLTILLLVPLLRSGVLKD
jgi:hypothetical protein